MFEIVLWIVGGFFGFLLFEWLHGIVQAYWNAAVIRLTEKLFEFGMMIKRKNEAGELNALAKGIGWLYILLVFIPVDYYLQFKVASEQFQVTPRFELTTSLVNRYLYADAAVEDEWRRQLFVVKLRELLDDYEYRPIDGVRAAAALGYFDIIDTAKGDTEHFRNANLFRSRFDPNRR